MTMPVVPAITPVVDPPPAGGTPTVVPPVATPPAKDLEGISMSAEAFKERLASQSATAQRKLAKDFGFDSPEAMKAALDKGKALEAEKLTEAEKSAKRIKELEPHEGRAKALEEQIAKIVSSKFDKLTDAVKEAIDVIAGGDPQKRLAQIEFMEATAAAVPVPPVVIPPPAGPLTKAAPGGAPPPPSGGTTKFQEWKAMEAKSPLGASIFYRANALAIEESRPAG